MKFILDTNALIFYIMGDENLPKKLRETIEKNECYYSYVSLWEIAIKQGINKLKIPYTIQDMDTFCKAENFIPLPLMPDHIEQTKHLPLIHRDPFDRMLVAQAQIENFSIITCDTTIPKYNVEILW